jgi:hypothetical protein
MKRVIADLVTRAHAENHVARRLKLGDEGRRGRRDL